MLLQPKDSNKLDTKEHAEYGTVETDPATTTTADGLIDIDSDNNNDKNNNEADKEMKQRLLLVKILVGIILLLAIWYGVSAMVQHYDSSNQSSSVSNGAFMFNKNDGVNDASNVNNNVNNEANSRYFLQNMN